MTDFGDELTDDKREIIRGTFKIGQDHIELLTQAIQQAISSGVTPNGIQPDRIGEYKVVQQLGQGGFGVVYLAVDQSGQKYAIKLPNDDKRKDERIMAQFAKEAEIAQKLDHKGIVKTIKASTDAGIPYMVLEYHNEPTLEDWLADPANRASLNVYRVIALIRSIGESLEYAHQQQIIHRDIKPNNILINREGHSPKLMDFGLAIQFGNSIEQSISYVVVGSPNYIAPEQALAQKQLIDHRSDIWSVGAIMYQLLSGKLPFEGKTTVHTLLNLLTKPAADLRMIKPDIPPSLAAICHRCLHKKPQDRYQSVNELLNDLSQFELGKKTQATIADIAQKEKKWTQTRLINPISIGILLLSIVGGLYSWISNSPDSRATIPAPLPIDPTPPNRPDNLFKLTTLVHNNVMEREDGWAQKNKKIFLEIDQIIPATEYPASLINDWLITQYAEEWEEKPWNVPTGHFEFIKQSPDGKLLAIGQTRQSEFVPFFDWPTNEVYIVDASTLTELHRFKINAHKTQSNQDFDDPVDGCRAFVFARDNKHLYISTRSGWIHVYDLDKKMIIHEWQALDEFVGDMELSPNGRLLYVTGRYSGNIKEVNLSSKPFYSNSRLFQSKLTGKVFASCLIINPKRDFISIFTGRDLQWRIDTNTLSLGTLPSTPMGIMAAVWPMSPAKSACLQHRDWAMYMNAPTIEFIDAYYYAITDKWVGDIKDATEITALSSEGRYLVARGNTVGSILDLSNKQVVKKFLLHQDQINYFLDQRKQLLVLGDSKNVTSLVAKPSKLSRVICGSALAISRFHLIPNKDMVLIHSNSKLSGPSSRACLWKISTDEQVNEIINHFTVRIDEVSVLSPDHQHVLFSLGRNWLHIAGWEPRTDVEFDFGEHGNPLEEDRVYHPDGKSFWIVEKNHATQLSAVDFKRLSRTEDRNLSTVDERYRCLSMIDDQLIAARGTGVIDVFNPHTQKWLYSITTSFGQIQLIRKMHKGLWIAGTRGGHILLIDSQTKTCTPISAKSPHVGIVRALAVHPSGNMFVSGGVDGKMMMWVKTRAGTWNQQFLFPNNNLPVTQVDYNETGSKLYSIYDSSHHVIEWNLDEIPKGFFEPK